MRGRKPTPTALKLLKGNPGRRRLPKNEPKPKHVIPTAPEHITRQAALAWGKLSTMLARLRVLTEADAMALEVLCEEYAEILMLREDLATNGWFEQVTRTNGSVVTVARAAYERLADAERRFRGMMCEFGLTPSARSRVTATPSDDSHTDPAAAYFG